MEQYRHRHWEYDPSVRCGGDVQAMSPAAAAPERSGSTDALAAAPPGSVIVSAFDQACRRLRFA